MTTRRPGTRLLFAVIRTGCPRAANPREPGPSSIEPSALANSTYYFAGLLVSPRQAYASRMGRHFTTHPSRARLNVANRRILLIKSETVVPRKSRFRAHGVVYAGSCHSKA